MTFQKAERKQARPKLALTGPSGSGKTFSALLLAAGMGKRIAVIDTENGSASLYANMEKGPLKGIDFDVLEIAPPYSIDKYVQAIEAAVTAKYDVCVVDSISHAWAGEGGLLSKKEALDQRGGNSYTNWAGITKEHEIFKARILNAEIILICTMRSKQDYVLEVNEKGKSAPKKVGMAPIQRDGMEYEFTTVFDVAMDHHAVASKDRTSMFDGQIFKIARKTGEQIISWLSGGKPVESKPAQAPAAAASEPTKSKAADAPAPTEPAGVFPGEDEEVMISQAQTETIKGLIAAILGPKRSESTIWGAIRQQVPHEFGELTELTSLEAGAVTEYLKSWYAHVSKTSASAAAAAVS
jgi:hypothetical protein